MSLAQWAEPALLWGNSTVDREKPQLLELTSDDFLPEFLAAMNTAPDKKNSSNPVALNFLDSAQMKASTLTLYQPLHSRYYLVTASLICHQLGFPDKEVDIKKGEKTFFVLRRMKNNQEQGWSDKRGWVDIIGSDCPVAPDEEQFPAHPVTVCTGKDSNILPCERKIYYGYIATGNREKYLDKQGISLPSTSAPEDKIKQFFVDANKGHETDNTKKFDQRFQEFDTKVFASWDFLIRSKTNDKFNSDAIQPASLNILLDFIDILQRTLPKVWKKIISADVWQSTSSVNLYANQKALYDFLDDPRPATINKINRTSNGALITLRTAFNELKDYVNLVHGDDSINDPPTTYDVSNFTDDMVEDLKTKVKNALGEENSPMTFASPADAEERLSLIEKLVKKSPSKTADSFYFLRMIYDYDPECPPIVSADSSPFTFARNLEPSAPARVIRIEMPSIKPADLRKFRHGVGLQMSPELNKVMGQVNEGMLKGDGLGSSSGLDIGMICTFSIQIITLIAFIVMFIFAILLNIIFWWLAFLKICLPIPE